MRSHFEPGKRTLFLTAFLTPGGQKSNPMSCFGGGIRAPKSGHPPPQIGHPPSAVWQWWNCPAGAANHVEPGLGVLRFILDGASVCFSQGRLMFEWRPTARHNIDTKIRQFARNRCFESLNFNTNYALRSDGSCF